MSTMYLWLTVGQLIRSCHVLEAKCELYIHSSAATYQLSLSVHLLKLSACDQVY